MHTTEAQILKHHGGDGDKARETISSTYESRHDDDFWQFWDDVMAAHYQPGDAILDMGAGTGLFVKDMALRYPNSSVIGLEAAPYMLEHLVALPNNAQVIRDDLHHPTADISANSVGMVMSSMVVHELTQPIKMFKAAYQWLKPGGRLCIIDIVRQPLGDYLAHRYQSVSPWAKETTQDDLNDAFEHFLEHNRYHPQDIIYMLELGGFKVVEKTLQRNERFIRIVVEK